ncbi:MAG TPA: type VI secretion system tip protein TssI/VgrG [Caulobacteraceae bacterium]|nr:type VI secretion system tip protein TssI/VgrG [Caulobacteraceae bacterium]
MPARQAVISLPFSQPVLLETFEAVERFSELFVITVDVLAEEPIDFADSLGKSALITVNSESCTREFSGLIFETELVDQTSSGNRYRLTLRPWLYALTRNREFFIFQEKSTVDILQDVFNSRGCNDFDLTKLRKSYPTREYCVQYRESDFAFLSRLMEEEGIYYFFEHRGGKHVLVLCDDRTAHDVGVYSSLPYISHAQGVLPDRVWRWTESLETGVEGKATFRNFDFKRPRERLEGVNEPSTPAGQAGGAEDRAFLRLRSQEAPEGSAMPAHKAEVYDFPSLFLDNDRGNTLTETTMQALMRHRRSYRGEGDAVGLACGDKLQIEGHPVGRLDETYLIVGLNYRVRSEQYTSGQGDTGAAGEEPVVVQIFATPADQPWRAPQTTPRPVAQGPETAIVVGGDAGETIYTDEYGRVKVKFHWDRASEDSDTTCWVRVASASADNGFGHVALPRIGQEVVVNFLNGNPDRPLIIGSVFNGDKRQPYALPDDKTRSVWRSHTIDGGHDDYNEVSMEDKKGSEVLNVQAQKDRTTLVKHDDVLTVGNDKSTTVKQGNLSMIVKQGDESREVETGKRETKIKQNDVLTIDQGNQNTTLNMGNSSHELKMGNYSLKADLGQISNEAMQSITLTVGQSSITIDQTGVTIKGMMINIQAQVQLQAQGTMTQVSGSAMTQIQGGIIMIN